MVKLNKIYTRTGDDGTTGLVDGSRRAKHSARIEAVGVVDEANSVIGHALVVLDGKRNDIGATATAYADGYLGPPESCAWGADALTVSPYLGDDSLTPFVDVAVERGAGVFVLVKTSNPGGATFQDLDCGGQPFYRLWH